MRYPILLDMPPRRHRWPWWARSELFIDIVFFAIVSGLTIGLGYWLMSTLAAWRMLG